MTTKIVGNQITNYTIDTEQLSNTAVAAFAKTLAPKVLYANVASNTFTVLDDTAVNVGGGYIVVTGAEFQSGATVLIDTVPASAVTFVNSTTLQAQIPAKSAASYNLYVVNPDGGVGIKVSGVTYSSEPSWVTTSPLANQVADTTFNVTLSATGATSYAVAAGSTLPAGTTLAANGYFSGTVSIGAETTYTFSIVATDAENQDSSKTFQVTVTVIPQVALYSWGNGSDGQLGLNDTVNRSSPVQIGSGTDWIIGVGKISMGQPQAAIKNNGTLWMWGMNAQGQLGQNNTIYSSSPTQVGSGTDWNFVSASTYQTFAIKTTGTLWTWGGRGDSIFQNFGQNGLNLNVFDYGANRRSSPTQIGSDTNWSLVSAGQYCAAAIKTDGTLWTWGRNDIGQLGVNNTSNRSSPTQSGTENTWSKIVIGSTQACAIKTDGTLWTWGRNAFGSLGLNISANTYRSSPTQVGTDTTWSMISGFQNMVGAIKTDGTLWTWGHNNVGQLGQNNADVSRSSPTQVGTGTNWSVVDCHQGLSLAAIKTNGTLWTWGWNNQGQLGLNLPNPYTSSPTQVGSGTGWNNVVMASTTMIATRII